MVHSARLRLRSRGHTDLHDLTEAVGRLVAESGIAQGAATVFTPSSTSSLTTIEFEPGALDDLRQALEALAPAAADYRHNAAWGDGNGHAHLRAALLGPSLTIPVVDGRLLLGTWQQIVFLDFDVRARTREIVVQVIGEAA
jgi:secondary thiamine-phosphate synthase enzyme